MEYVIHVMNMQLKHHSLPFMAGSNNIMKYVELLWLDLHTNDMLWLQAYIPFI